MLTVQISYSRGESEAFSAAKRHLCESLRANGTVLNSPETPVRDRKGKPLRRILYSWTTSLDRQGAASLVTCLGEILRSLGADQVAATGHSGGIMLAYAIASGAVSKGIYVRPEQKGHGALRQIEGEADRSLPIVVIDDILASGTSLRKCVDVLEKHGYHVGGVVSMVGWPDLGGQEWAEAMGYQVASILNGATELDFSAYPKNIARPPEPAGDRYLVSPSENPADVAREVLTRYLQDGSWPLEDQKFPGLDKAAGGVSVSLRCSKTNRRIVRKELFHPLAGVESADTDFLAALWSIANDGALKGQTLDRLKFAVGAFSEGRTLSPKELNLLDYGIVLRSRAYPWRFAALLPNSDVVHTEVGQYREVGSARGRFPDSADLELFGFTVARFVETGATWPETGASTPEDHRLGRDFYDSFLQDIRAQLRSALSGIERTPETVFPCDLPIPKSVVIGIYGEGFTACWSRGGNTIQEAITGAVERVLADPRGKGRISLQNLDELTVVGTLLLDSTSYGPLPVAEIAKRVRPDIHSLYAHANGKTGFLLGYVAGHKGWSSATLAEQCLVKGKIDVPNPDWTVYRSKVWSSPSSQSETVPLVCGYPESDDRFDARTQVERCATYLLKQIDDQGKLRYCYDIVSGRIWQHGAAARIIHAACSLVESGRLLKNEAVILAGQAVLDSCVKDVRQFQKGRAFFMNGEPIGIGAEVVLLAKLGRVEPDLLNEKRFAESIDRVCRLFHPDGAISTASQGMRTKVDHDILPGYALQAAAAIQRAGLGEFPHLERARMFYRRRFTSLHPWLMLPSQMEAWSLWSLAGQEEESASFALELADWSVEHQLIKDGSFVFDIAPHTESTFWVGCFAEGLAQAWKVAQTNGLASSGKYEGAWERAVKWMSKLTVDHNIGHLAHNPDLALGGVRLNRSSPLVRVDFVSHYLFALCQGLENLSRPS